MTMPCHAEAAVFAKSRLTTARPDSAIFATEAFTGAFAEHGAAENTAATHATPTTRPPMTKPLTRQQTKVPRRKIVLAINYRHYQDWLRDNNLSPSDYVHVYSDEQLLGLELSPDDVIDLGGSPVDRFLLSTRIRLPTRSAP